MTNTPESHRLSRLWTAMIEASAAAVTAHYAAPWNAPAASRGDAHRRDDGPACSA